MIKLHNRILNVGNWDYFLKDIFNNVIVYKKMYTILKSYEKNVPRIYPAYEDIFKAFKLCPYEKLSVVILGQDPYHDGSATGLAFANRFTPNSNLSPSLRIIKDNISKVIHKSGDFAFDSTLENWAEQGVLLLNTSLTVEVSRPLSHVHYWETFTELVLRRLSRENENIIYCLWGKYANKYEKFINKESNIILTHTHPAYSLYSGKPWKCDHFSKINEILNKKNNSNIIW